MTYRKTVVGVVYQDRGFLLVQKPHWNGRWDFPQGGVEEGESLEQAVLREMREELGTDGFGTPTDTNLTLQRPFSPETLRHYSDQGFSGKDLHYFAIPFTGSRDAIVLGDDLSAKTWCDEEGLFKLIHQDSAGKVKDVIRFMKANGFI